MNDDNQNNDAVFMVLIVLLVVVMMGGSAQGFFQCNRTNLERCAYMVWTAFPRSASSIVWVFEWNELEIVIA